MAARMNNAEAIMWAVESDPFLRSDFTNVTLLTGPPDGSRLRAALSRAIASYPPLRQRVVGAPLGLAPPAWVDDPDFDFDYHLRRVAVPPPGNLRQLLDLTAALAAAPIDRARPLWELTVVEGLEGGRTAVLQRLHHTMSDGVGAMKLLRALLERTPGDTPDPTTDRPPLDPLVWRHPELFSPPSGRGRDPWADERRHGDWPPAGRRNAVGDVVGALGYRLGQVRDAARRSVELAASVPYGSSEDLRVMAEGAGKAARSVADQVMISGGALSPLLVGRSLARHLEVYSLGLHDLRRAARRLGGGRNDVFVAGVSGALLAYHQRMGAPCDALRMATAISLRGGTGPTGGNHFAPARMVVPIGPKDPAERLRLTRRCLAALAAEPGIGLADSLAGLINLLPPAVLTQAFRAQARTVDFATSIVPGLRGRRWLAGSEVVGSWPVGPRIGCAGNFTLASCGDRLELGINLDPAAFSDPGSFMECLTDSFEALLDAD